MIIHFHCYVIFDCTNTPQIMCPYPWFPVLHLNGYASMKSLYMSFAEHIYAFILEMKLLGHRACADSLLVDNVKNFPN